MAAAGEKEIEGTAFKTAVLTSSKRVASPEKMAGATIGAGIASDERDLVADGAETLTRMARERERPSIVFVGRWDGENNQGNTIKERGGVKGVRGIFLYKEGM